MHDLGRNQWLQNVALIPPLTTLTPIGLEALVLKISRVKRTESSLKLHQTQAYGLTKLTCKR